VRGVPASGLADVRHDSAQRENSADALVLGAYLMTTDTRGISALVLQRQLGLSRYETAWIILHKLRRAMVNAAREPLYGEVEGDDTWIGGPQPGLRGSRQLKGRHAVPILVAVEKRATAPACADERAAEFQRDHGDGADPAIRRAGFDGLHRRVGRVRRAA
jgi:hypothetical protein